MKRKVIQQGHNALTITLPAKWTQRFSIGPKDFLNLEEQGNALVVSTEKQAQESEAVSFDITGLSSRAIDRVIRGLYMKGVSQLTLTYKNEETVDDSFSKKISVFDAIQHRLNHLINFEAVEQGKGYCKVHDVATSSSKEFYPLTRRIFLLLREAGNALLEGASKNDMHLLKTVKHKHDVISKFVIFCIRVLNKEGYKTGIEGVFKYNPDFVIFYYYDFHALHEIADLFVGASNFIISTQTKLGKDSCGLLKEFMKMFEIFYEMFYNYDVEKVNELERMRKKIENKFLEMAKKKYPPGDLLFCSKIIEGCHRFAFMSESETAIRTNHKQ